MSLNVLGLILLKILTKLFNNSYIIRLKHTKPPIHWKLSNGTKSMVGDLGDLNVHAWQANKPTNNLPSLIDTYDNTRECVSSQNKIKCHDS